MELKDNYYTALIDADTILYAAAAVIQRNPLIATMNGISNEFDNITAFRKWLKSEDGEKYKEEDFHLEVVPELTDELRNAFHTIKLQFQKIQNQPWCRDIKIFIGGDGNYRKDMYPEYKNKRADKPLAYQDCHNYITKVWGKKTTVCHGEEAEDRVSIEAWKSYQVASQCGDRNKMDVVICAIDKDLDMCAGWHFNYHKPKLGVYWVDYLQGWRAFCKQCLTGDRATDNIQGVYKVTKALKEKYVLKGTRGGVGDATAEVILGDAVSSSELFGVVLDVYQTVFPDTWKEELNLNIALLWMRKYDNQILTFEEICDGLGIEYE